VTSGRVLRCGLRASAVEEGGEGETRALWKAGRNPSLRGVRKRNAVAF
jgi:hypothetical protein